MIRREAVRLMALSPFAAAAVLRRHSPSTNDAGRVLLLAYTTVEGQTRKIMEAVAAQAATAGIATRLLDVGVPHVLPRASEIAGVVVASSIHYGKHAKAAVRFAGENRAMLEARPSAFLSVSLSEAQPAKRSDAQRFLAEFATVTGWTPTSVVSIAGALRYREYGFIKRAMLKKIAGDGGLPTDTSRDHEFTDWPALQRFTSQFLVRVASVV